MKKVIVLIVAGMMFLTSCTFQPFHAQIDEPSASSDETFIPLETAEPTDTVTTTCNTEIVQPETLIDQNGTTDTSINDTTDDTIGDAVGGTDYCTIHHSAYHMIPGWLIDYVGKDKFEEWQNSLTVDNMDVPTEGCNRAANIKTVIDYFGIPEDIFSEYCTYPIDCVYNLKVLYHSSEEDIDLYYRDTEYFLHDSDRCGHYDKFLEIIWFDYEKEIAELGLNQSLYNIFTLSPPEVVQRLNITRDVLEEIFKKAADDRISVHGVCYTYEYNLDMIYGEDGVSFEPLEKLLAVNEDGDPDNDISSNELREMFCRVGRYAE